MAADKNIDPRFDPAFQRGYADSTQGAQSDAVRAARTVDALRDDAADAQYSKPQSHYVDDEGAIAEFAPAGRGKSLARNPWIYVLWVVGIVVTIGGIAAQVWAYSQLYSQSGLNVDDYGLITAIQGLAPIAATIGALSIVGALMIHALNWMRKNQ